MGADARGGPMEDRAEIEVDGLQRTEGALDLSQVLIRAHGGAGIERAVNCGLYVLHDAVERLNWTPSAGPLDRRS